MNGSCNYSGTTKAEPSCYLILSVIWGVLYSGINQPRVVVYAQNDPRHSFKVTVRTELSRSLKTPAQSLYIEECKDSHGLACRTS